MTFALFLGRAVCAAASRFRHGSRWALLLAVSTLLLASSGCSLTRGVREFAAYNDGVNDFVLGWRNSVWARQAWQERAPHFIDQPHLGAFGAGFRAGYTDVATGGTGCPPPLPPRKYWNWKYQTPEGQSKVAAWFSGYPYGAQAAEEEQAGEYQNIQVSYLIEQQYSPEFQSGEMLDLDAQPRRPTNGFFPDSYPDPGLLNAPNLPYQETRRLTPQGRPSLSRNPGPTRLDDGLQSYPNRQVSYLQPVEELNATEPTSAQPSSWPTE